MDTSHDDTRKIISIQEAIALAQRYRDEGKIVVTTNGCFDLLHVGHIRSLQLAKQEGDVLFVGLNIDEYVRDNKGADRPYVPGHERIEMVASLACVDYAFLYEESEPMGWIEKLQPQVHVKGGDYTEDIIEKVAVESSGGRVVIVPHSGHSTTEIVKKIKSSN